MLVTYPSGWSTVAGTDTTHEPLISIFSWALYRVTEKDVMSDMTRRYLQIKRIPGK